MRATSPPSWWGGAARNCAGRFDSSMGMGVRVLQVVPELNSGGVERTTLEVVDALVQAGHTAHVASEGGAMEGELLVLGGHLHRLPVATKNPLKWTANAANIGAIIREYGIDLVHARSRAPAFAAKAAARREGVPFVTTYHGIYNANNPLKRAYNAVMASGDVVIANSEFTKRHIMSEHGTDSSRIRVVPRGVDMAKFDPATVSKADRRALRTEWGVPQNAKLWLLPGRITEWKGQEYAVSAVASTVLDPQENHLVLLGRVQGSGAYKDRLDELVACLEGFADRVHFRPHTEDMATAYAAADVVLSTSTDPEAFGRVAAEAQAMGVPVVATAHGGSLETVEDGVTGRLVSPNDGGALAVAVQEVLGWVESGRYSGAYARAQIQERFSDTALKRAVLDIYGEVLGTKTDALP